jgi:hypothetical protein
MMIESARELDENNILSNIYYRKLRPAMTVIRTSCALLPRSSARDWRPVLGRTQNLPLEWRSRGTTALRAAKFKASDQTFNL